MEGTESDVADFVLSCRVMGRGVEQTMLHVLVNYARACGAQLLRATYLPTERNGPCKSFFDERSGFVRSENGVRYEWDVTEAFPAPEHIDIRYGDSTKRVPGEASHIAS